MSSLRERAKEIKAAGVAERGNFEPHGVPLRMYNYWLENSPSSKARAIRNGQRRENFCHFWRVVVAWAPLLWAYRNNVDTKAFKAVAVITALFVLGLIVSTTGAGLETLVVFGIAAVAFAIGVGIRLLYRRFWDRDWNRMVGNIALWLLISTTSIGLVVVVVAATIDMGWIILAWLAATLAGAGIITVVLVWLSEFISGRRAIARKRLRDWLAQLSNEELDEYIAKQERPGVVKRFFSGLADFLVLIIQIVRVNKWKICPLVDVDSDVR